MIEQVPRVLISASAPGKVILSGEYAVLDGAPAICMAVNRRARVTISVNGEEFHTVTAPGLTTDLGRFTDRDGELGWIAAGENFALLEEVWRAANVSPPTGLSLQLDSREFIDAASGKKVGIGSSAALAVALAAALCELGDSAGDSAGVAFGAHRQFQDGLGSGADIACSSAGGIIEYCMGDSKARSTGWPEGLDYALLWSGVPVSTGRKIRRLAERTAQPSRDALGVAARRLAKAWREASTAAILDEFRAYTGVLREFSIDHELGIFDAGHADLVAAADSAGLVYKPCGAGGGDMGVVLADNAAAIESFVGDALPRNFQVLNMNVDPCGMRVVRDAG